MRENIYAKIRKDTQRHANICKDMQLKISDAKI